MRTRSKTWRLRRAERPQARQTSRTRQAGWARRLGHARCALQLRARRARRPRRLRRSSLTLYRQRHPRSRRTCRSPRTSRRWPTSWRHQVQRSCRVRPSRIRSGPLLRSALRLTWVACKRCRTTHWHAIFGAATRHSSLSQEASGRLIAMQAKCQSPHGKLLVPRSVRERHSLVLFVASLWPEIHIGGHTHPPEHSQEDGGEQ